MSLYLHGYEREKLETSDKILTIGHQLDPEWHRVRLVSKIPLKETNPPHKMIRYYRWVIMDYQIYIMSENTDTTFIPLRDRDMEFTIVTYLIVVRQGCIRSHDNIHLKLFIKISHLAT